jgi:hypothetical protein
MSGKYFLGSLSLSIAAILAACSNATGNSHEADQTNIFGDYSVVQKGSEDSVKLFTWFRYAGQTGTTLRLTDGSEISANEQRMNLVEGSSQTLNFTGSYYTQSLNASLLANEYSFEWKRNDGKVFRNTIPAPKKIEAVLMLDDGNNNDVVIRAGQTAHISVARAGFTVTYEGSDLGTDERIDCMLWSEVEGDNRSSDYSMSGKWNSTLKNCVFGKEGLQRFRIGTARLEMIRKWRQENKANGHERAGSAMSSLYFAHPIAVEISP